MTYRPAFVLLTLLILSWMGPQIQRISVLIQHSFICLTKLHLAVCFNLLLHSLLVQKDFQGPMKS